MQKVAKEWGGLISTGLLLQGLLAPLFHAALMVFAPTAVLQPPIPAQAPESPSWWTTSTLCPRVIQGITIACQAWLLVQGLHYYWWTALQQTTQATTFWGPGWLHWCPVFPSCVPASHSKTSMVAPQACPSPWVMDLGSLPQDQKHLVLTELQFWDTEAKAMGLDPAAFGCHLLC